MPKLNPQIYDRKPSIDDEDSRNWHQENGLSAQEVYYDAPESRRLVGRGKAQYDEEGNEITLPDIPSINPQEDPDYSAWGEEPASSNYIGLIAHLVKANNELHERVKILETQT